MKKILFASIMLGLISIDGLCELPPSFLSLKQKLSAINQLRFKYSEHYTPTGVGIGSPPVPMVRDFRAIVSATRNEMFVTYSSTETGRSFENTGTFISDGKYEWNYQKRGGINNPSFVSKRPVGFEDNLIKKMSASLSEFNKLRPNCLSFEKLFDPELGTIWSPFKFYDELIGKKIVFDGTDAPNAEGFHHWTVQPEEGCMRIEFWIDDSDGTLAKFVAHNPYEGFEEQVEFVGVLSEKEKNIIFAPDLFTFDPKKFPGVQVSEINADKSAEMMINTFATPAKLAFESLFKVDASSVEELEGTGAAWFTYSYHLRFTADALPPLKKQLEFSVGEPSKATEFFKQSFPKDKGLISDISLLELKENHQGKNHFWVLHHRKKNVFFVRAWSDE